ncbi:FAD-dependent oxidoreductase [archaeon SCG-AAA382B04]|nr:FAD-dependent oxidoreductase [archaeon SCG-AAA382B04]
MKEIGILGGGLTGLTLAHLLEKRGHGTEILEKNEECGGLMRSIEKNGFTFDYGGSHVLFSRDEETLSFLLKQIEGNRVKNRRNTKILFKNKFVKYPFEYGLSNLPKKDNFECLYSYINKKIQNREDKEEINNLQDFFINKFGEGISKKYLLPYNKKIWNHPPKKMGLEWVKRIPNPTLEEIIKSSIGMDIEGYTHQLNFYYPKEGGIQSIIKSLRKKITNPINTNFKVEKIQQDPPTWRVYSQNNTKEFKKLISTIPIHDLLDSFDKVPNKIKNALNDLKFNSLITVMIGLDKENLSKGDLSWLYLPQEDVLSHRVSFPSNYSPKNSPKNKASILAEITCNYNDEIWSKKDNKIINKVKDDLIRLGIINNKKTEVEILKRNKYAYIIPTKKYAINRKLAKNYFEELGIDLVGRFSEFKYLNMDDCIRSVLKYLKNL